jgi:hypothetical protein
MNITAFKEYSISNEGGNLRTDMNLKGRVEQ